MNLEPGKMVWEIDGKRFGDVVGRQGDTASGSDRSLFFRRVETSEEHPKCVGMNRESSPSCSV